MLKLLFSALSLILAGVILLVVGLVPAVLSGMAWLVGLALFTAVFGALGFLFLDGAHRIAADGRHPVPPPLLKAGREEQC